MSAPPDPIFFTDRDLGKQFAVILRKAGVPIEMHSQHFADDTRDEIWLKAIGERGWYALTHDRRIRYKRNEIAAVRNHRLGLFVIVGKAPFPLLAENFVRTLPKIKQFIRMNARPFIAKIYQPEQKESGKRPDAPGSVRIWVSFK